MGKSQGGEKRVLEAAWQKQPSLLLAFALLFQPSPCPRSHQEPWERHLCQTHAYGSKEITGHIRTKDLKRIVSPKPGGSDPALLGQLGNPKIAQPRSPSEAIDSCVSPDIRAACPSSGRKGSALTSKSITAVLITFQLARIPARRWAGQDQRGSDRAGSAIEPA